MGPCHVTGSFPFSPQGDKWLAEQHFGETVRLTLYHQANLEYMGLAVGSRGPTTQTLVYRIAVQQRDFDPHSLLHTRGRFRAAGNDCYRV